MVIARGRRCGTAVGLTRGDGRETESRKSASTRVVLRLSFCVYLKFKGIIRSCPSDWFQVH